MNTKTLIAEVEQLREELLRDVREAESTRECERIIDGWLAADLEDLLAELQKKSK